jgi:hypothetical protein
MGTYAAVRYDYNSAADHAGLSTVTFDGAANFSGSDSLNSVETVAARRCGQTRRLP